MQFGGTRVLYANTRASRADSHTTADSIRASSPSVSCRRVDCNTGVELLRQTCAKEQRDEAECEPAGQCFGANGRLQLFANERRTDAVHGAREAESRFQR